MLGRFSRHPKSRALFHRGVHPAVVVVAVRGAVRAEVPAEVPVVAAAAAVAAAVGVDVMKLKDRFGLGWRPQLAAGILSNLDKIDFVEVIADDFFCASRQQRRMLRTLSAQIPITLHGVSLGLASAAAVEARLLDRMARLIEEVSPISWSEHLAFVRGGGTEIGHLAAPPRTAETIEGTLVNLKKANAVVSVAPQLENVATLIEPPGSDLDEAEWISTIIQNSESDLLLDLHNLYANGCNFAFDPREFIARIPSERIAAIHLAGGKWIGGPGASRLLDDHLHDVPEPVYQLLIEIGARSSRHLSVIIERDGAFPPFDHLLRQLDRARQALTAGRARRLSVSREAAAA
jgi:uncharacterized protein